MSAVEHFLLRRVYLVLLPVFLMFMAGCTETQVIQQAPFNDPPDNTFLGYFDVAEQLTTCGNCHVLHQRDWARTAHADAISALAGNNNTTAECYQCHTVSERGNVVDGSAGYELVQTDVYHNVQCESCHGPALDHVRLPDAGQTLTNPPLAHISLPLDADSVTLANSPSCGSCHNQNSGPGVRAYEEWAASGHARSLEEEPGVFVADNPSCASCHEGKAALAAWGVSANYAERSLTGSSNYLGQTCSLCHDPHGSAADPTTGEPLEHQLRFPISTPDVNQNLCMKCHQRRSQPDQASSRGPHSPQGPMLLGEAGYQPAGFEPDLQAVASTHGTDKNPELCAGCHVQRLEGTDAVTGKPAISAGHLFLAIPCLDVGGLPSLTNHECSRTEPARSWAACTASGCHGSASVAVAALTGLSQDLDRLTAEIWDDVNGNDAVNPDSTACSTLALPCANPTGSTVTDSTNRANWDEGLLARTDLIPTTEYVTNDNRITPAEGARFNVRMLREGGADGSHGVHNPFLARALLGATLTELRDVYPGLPALSAPVQRMMSGRLGAILQRVYHPPTGARLSLSR